MWYLYEIGESILTHEKLYNIIFISNFIYFVKIDHLKDALSVSLNTLKNYDFVFESQKYCYANADTHDLYSDESKRIKLLDIYPEFLL
jgi:hypothetical protein